MKYLILSMLMLSSFSYAQKSSPLLNENKFTVCAITINSDTEKKIFQKQIAKEPKKFNPIVELTDMGDDQNWFQKACASGIRCDQLVISGHFAGEFFGHDSDKKLGLDELEKAGCTKSCEGILKKPYEVFLFGCNTLADKEDDSRTPAEYLQVLLHDGFPLAQAEMVVQSRYGSIGDSNKSTMQRAFAGEEKKLYGFSSVGPSGKTVKQFLEGYFTKTKLSTNLDKLQAARMLNKTTEANKILAESLKSTAFSQCNSAKDLDEKSKNICTLKDPDISIDKKLTLITDLLTKDDALLYLPSINQFLAHNSPNNFTTEEKEQLKVISNNKIIGDQIMGLINKTEGLGLKSVWVDLATNIGFISKEEARNLLIPEFEKIFSKPLSDNDLNAVCFLEGNVTSYINLTEENFKNKIVGKRELNAMSCLNIQDPKTLKRMMAFKPVDREGLELQIEVADYLPASESLPPQLINYLKVEMRGKDDPANALRLLHKHYPADPDVKRRAEEILKTGTEDGYLKEMAKEVLGIKE